MPFPFMAAAATAATVYGSVAGGGGGGSDQGILGDPEAENLFDMLAKMVAVGKAEWAGSVNKAIIANPWDSATPYDPSSSSFDPGSALTDAITKTNLVDYTQWMELISTAVTARAEEGTFETVDYDLIAESAMVFALEWASQGWDEVYAKKTGVVNNYFDRANNKIDTLLTSIRSFIHNGIRDDVNTEVGDAKDWARVAAIQALSDSNTQAGADASGNLTTGHTNAKANIAIILSDALTEASSTMSSAISAALTAAAAVIDDTVITDARNAHEARTNYSYQRLVSQFTGGMRDINAVNSSAFIFGLSNLAAEREHDLAKFDADLSMDLYRQAFPLAVSVFSSAFDRYSGIYLTKLEMYFRQIAVGQPEYIKTFLMNLSERLQTYRSVIPAYLQTDANMINQHTGMSNNISNNFLQDFRNYFNTFVNASMSGEMQSVQSKDSFLINAISDQFNLLSTQAQGYRELALIEQEMDRMYNAEQRIYKEDGLAYSDRDSKWALEILKYPQNLLGSASGGTTSPESVPLGRAVLGSAISSVANHLANKMNTPPPSGGVPVGGGFQGGQLNSGTLNLGG